jgi:U3 small nucleolar RNA-associated protein 13
MDNHEDKIWGLTVRGDEKMFVTGGADSVINFWEDVTAEEQEKEAKEKEELILR